MGQVITGMFAYELHGMVWSVPAPYSDDLSPGITEKFQQSQSLTFSEALPAGSKVPNPATYPIPMIAGFIPPAPAGSIPPPITARGELPIVGFYPVTELGYMNFDASGDVTGAYRINIAGSAMGLKEIPFSGQYVWLPYSAGTGAGTRTNPVFLGAPSPAGLISSVVTVPGKGTSNFDYAFVLVSKDEMLLTASTRIPRAGVLSGTMKRISL